MKLSIMYLREKKRINAYEEDIYSYLSTCIVMSLVRAKVPACISLTHYITAHGKKDFLSANSMRLARPRGRPLNTSTSTTTTNTTTNSLPSTRATLYISEQPRGCDLGGATRQPFEKASKNTRFSRSAILMANIAKLRNLHFNLLTILV